MFEEKIAFAVQKERKHITQAGIDGLVQRLLRKQPFQLGDKVSEDHRQRQGYQRPRRWYQLGVLALGVFLAP